MNIKPLFPAVIALLGATLTAGAGELGSQAKPLQITDWIKGKSLNLADARGKQVVVVEFWATWCAPCRTSIPHLTELQKKFKDKGVVFVGISDEKPDVVRKFVEKLAEKMDYTVAVDDARKTSAAYMKEFGVNGIPHAFVVDKEGKIVWHGHPMADLESVLTEVTAGKYDLAKAKKREEGRKKIEEFYELARQDKDPARQARLAQEIAATESEVGNLNSNQKFDPAAVRKMIVFQKALREYQQGLASGAEAAKLSELEKRLEQNGPPEFNLAEFKANMEVTKTFGEYLKLAKGSADREQMTALAKKLVSTKTKNAQLLNEMAWTILTDEEIKTRDLELATKLAKAGVEASEGKEPAVLDTYARALFDSDKKDEAIAQQKKAIAAAEDDAMREELKATLKDYETKAAK